MTKTILIIFCLIGGITHVTAQQNAEAAYGKLMQLTRMFHGREPYACYAIVEMKYKKGPNNTLRDTSKLIYKNGATYYKSKLVERVAASQGELIINHELKTASFHISDSLEQVVQKDLKVMPDKEMETMLDSNAESSNLQVFKNYMLHDCTVAWDTKEGYDEITFTSKSNANAVFLSMKIRFTRDSKVLCYEYTTREMYATDMNGSGRFRIVRTIYDNFNYDNVPDIPSKLSDFIQWDGWTMTLKKYTNYKLSVL